MNISFTVCLVILAIVLLFTTATIQGDVIHNHNDLMKDVTSIRKGIFAFYIYGRYVLQYQFIHTLCM